MESRGGQLKSVSYWEEQCPAPSACLTSKRHPGLSFLFSDDRREDFLTDFLL